MKYPIFVISLAKDEERRNQLKKQFSSYDEFNIIDAIEGNKLNIQEYFKYLSASLEKYNVLISPNELGCTLSHIKAYEEFLRTDVEYCLILEDDIIGSDEIIEKAFSLTDKIPENAMILLGGGYPKAWGKKIADNFYQISRYSLERIYNAHAYILDRQAAENLLTIQKDAATLTDIWCLLLPQKNISLYFSDLIRQNYDENLSNIEIEREIKTKNHLNPRKIRGLKYNLMRIIDRHFSEFIVDK
ncbi:MAG: glycosyltransferase family 25 protein [Cardiobacteriaceae bacterium]|nr:glycosyltransferase family 25 protein [Cardiobacteriaceae bacterium]